MTTATQKIPAGYKQTEVGVILEDWDVAQLGSECDLITKGTTPTSIGRCFRGSGINFIKIESLEDCGKIKLDKVAFIDDETNFLLKRSELRDGDLLFSIAGALGRVALVNKNILPANTNQALAIIRLKRDAIFDVNYIFYFLNSSKIKKHFDSISVQGAQANLSLQNINELPIEYPKLKFEQSSIAKALSDADALIEKLEKLIRKKKNIKQGAMQELLTGKRRLPGFGGRWEIKNLGELFDIKDGTHQTPKYVDEGIPFYSVENVTRDDFKNTKYISIAEHKLLTKNFRIEEGDILMTRIGSIGDCKLITWKPNASFYVSLALLKPKNKQTSPYIYHFSKTNYFKKELEDRSLQWAVPKKINLGEISNVKIYLPVDPEEQAAIAIILFDMDTEIEKLESQLAKYQNIKQGMMQDLLTGKIRLI